MDPQSHWRIAIPLAIAFLIVPAVAPAANLTATRVVNATPVTQPVAAGLNSLTNPGIGAAVPGLSAGVLAAPSLPGFQAPAFQGAPVGGVVAPPLALAPAAPGQPAVLRASFAGGDSVMQLPAVPGVAPEGRLGSPGAAFTDIKEAAQGLPQGEGADVRLAPQVLGQVFDGAKLPAVGGQSEVAGEYDLTPKESYLGKPAEAALPEVDPQWRSAGASQGRKLRVRALETEVKELGEDAPISKQSSDLTVVAADAAFIEARLSADLQARLTGRSWTVPAGIKSAVSLKRNDNEAVVWLDEQGTVRYHDIAKGRTFKVETPGPVSLMAADSDGGKLYVLAGGKLQKWDLFSFKPAAETLQVEGPSLGLEAARSLAAVEYKSEKGVAVQTAGSRLYWINDRLIRLTQKEDIVDLHGNLIAGVERVSEGLYLQKTADGTRIYARSYASDDPVFEEVAALPLDVKSVVRGAVRGTFFAVAPEGVVELDAAGGRYRTFKVPGLAEAAAQGGAVSLMMSAGDQTVAVAAGRKVFQLQLGEAREFLGSRAAEVRLWSQANPMFVQGGFLHIGDFAFPVARKQAKPRPWTERAWAAVRRLLGREAPPAAALDMGISERDWQALNLPSNKRLIYDTLKGFSLQQHVLYIGETGGGKTWIASMLAQLTGNELWMVSMNEYTRNKDLIARETFGEEGKNKTGLTPSTVLRWMQEGGILVLDEMHKPLEGIAVLNNILQNGEYRLADGRVIKYDRTKSWVIGTMNPVKPPYKGEPPSGELSSRFGMTLDVKYLPPEEEEALLAIFFGKVSRDIIHRLVSIANDLRRMYPEILPLPIAPRTLMHIVQHVQQFPQDSVADIFTKTYNPSSIVEDPAIGEAISKVLTANGLGKAPAAARQAAAEGEDVKKKSLEPAVEEALEKPAPRPKAADAGTQDPKPADPPPSPPGEHWKSRVHDHDWDGEFLGVHGRWNRFGRHLPPMPFTSPKGQPAGGAADQGQEAWAKVLENVARLLAQYPPIRLVPFYYLEKHGERSDETPRTWRVVSGLSEIHYLPEDLADPDRNVSLGRTAHESWHLLHSRPELIFDHPDLADNMSFQALWWAVEDPRVNNLGLGAHPGAQPWVDAAYAKDYEIRDLGLERNQWQSIPLHLQFNYALIYEWWTGKPDPRVVDERVRDALRRADGALQRAFKAADARRAFDIVLYEIWPIYQELLDEATKSEMEQRAKQQQKRQQGQGQGQGRSSDDNLSDSERKELERQAKEKLEKASKEYRDKHASKVVDDPEKMSKDAREKAKREMEELRKKMEQARQKGQEGKEGQQESGEPQDGKQGQGGSGQASKKSSADKPQTPEQAAKQKSRLNKADQEKEDLSLEDRRQYQEFLSRVRGLVPTMRRELMHALKQKLRQRTIHNRDTGDLDEDALPSIPRGERDVFKEEMSPNKVLYRVSLLIDTSGSMDREKKERAVEGAVMMMEALEKVPGVVFEIVKYDSDPKVIKPYGTKLSPELKSKIVSMIMSGSGSTEAHVALKEAIERIRLGRGDKLVIMVNDGDPDYNFDRDQYRELIKGARDVEIHGIGLGPGAQLVLDLFPAGQGWWLKDAAEFAKSLRNILKKKIAKGARIS
ncbi:MAG: AAA family ATPase [Elusimicrobia bacterium]|nr:AAA family ATPase [Elusimicrobiota bacterium]